LLGGQVALTAQGAGPLKGYSDESKLRVLATFGAERHSAFPDAPTLQNYVSLFTNLPFAIYLRNSTIVATGTMCLALVVGSLGAYGFVRFRFSGRSPLLVAILMAYMIPSVVFGCAIPAFAGAVSIGSCVRTVARAGSKTSGRTAAAYRNSGAYDPGGRSMSTLAVAASGVT
jgi:hypothetical protein